MKSFLTLCMATAMFGSALSAEAQLSLKEAMLLKSQGKTMEQVYKTRDRNALKTIRQLPVSRFHKMMAQEEAKKNRLNVASKITALGDNIFGYLGYCDETGNLPVGYYELQPKGAKLLWEDPYYEQTGLACNNVAKIDNKIVGYIQDQVFGMLYGIYYVEFDAETGEVLRIDEQDIEFNKSNIGLFAYNPDDETFYGYGSYNGTRCFLSAPAWEPFNYKMIKPLQGHEMCLSMCYNPVEKAIYGVNMSYELVKIASDGRQTKIMNLNIQNGDSYVTGITYSARSNVYYWNINYKDGTAAMATIDPASKKVDVYEELSHCEEYYNLFSLDEYVRNPEEPLRPEAGTPDFGKGELVGYVPFTLPTHTKGGTKIVGEVEYTSYLNGEVYNSGKAEVGKETDSDGSLMPTVVNANFAVPESGKYSFSMIVKVNQLESSKGSTYAWIGNDTPVNPSNVRLTKSKTGNSGTYTVSWSPVTSGIHDGYVDLEKLEYKIRINGEEYTSYADSIEISLPEDKDLEAYTAIVKAVCNGLESEWVASNTVTEGTSYSLPMYITPTPEQYEVSCIIDNNNDGRTWMLEESSDPDNPYFIQTNFTTNSKETMDDWYFLPKMRIEDTSTFYSFSMETGIRSSSFRNEYMEVLLCNEPSVDGVLSTVVKEFKPLGTSFEKVDGLFRVPQAGDYYIALHCTSDGLQMGVKARNFEIDRSDATYDSPAAVKKIEITPGRNGALKATVAFEMPTMNLANQEISSETMLKATVSSPVETVTISGRPGQKVYANVTTQQGFNTILVQISDGDMSSLVSKTSVYTGVYIPATPILTSVEYSSDLLSMTLNWEPVTIGEDGEGYVNPQTVVYDIYKMDLNTNRWTLYQGDITNNSYTYEKEPGSAQEIILLGVLSRNEAGDNGELITAMGVLGTPYSLPIVEDFDNQGNMYTNPWLTTYLYGEGSWGLYYNSQVTGNLADKGISMIAQGENGVVSRLGSPKFSTKGVENASVTLELFNTKMPIVRILADMNGEEPEVIGEIDVNDFKNKTEKVSVEIPSKYLDKEWAGIYIEAEFDDDNQILMIESISIDGASNAVSTINGNSNISIIPGKGQIKVTGLEGRAVSVADIKGTIIGKTANTNEAIFSVENGIYVVTSGNQKSKVIVR